MGSIDLGQEKQAGAKWSEHVYLVWYVSFIVFFFFNVVLVTNPDPPTC